MQETGTGMSIERQETAAGEVVALRGELDLTNAGQLSAALGAAPARTVVLDLSELAFLDSAGIRAIDGVRGSFEQGGRRLLIVAPPESRAGWTLRVAGLADETVLESLEEAATRSSSEDGNG